MLTEMRTFVLLDEEGSIQKVAARLPLTQPAVTRQIQRLEETLGVELLDRRKKPPGITPAGRDILAHSRRILAAFDEMRRLGRGAEPRGLLRLGVANGLADDRFAMIATDLRARFPQVSLRLMTGWSAELTERLARGQLDAAVLLSPPQASSGTAPFGHETLAIVAAARQAGELRRPADLAGRAWILSPEPCDARQRLASAMADFGLPLSIAAEVQDARLQLALVREGAGLSLMPRRLLTDRPKGIAAANVRGIDLALEIRIERSPHLHTLGVVIDAIATRLAAHPRRRKPRSVKQP